RILGYQLTPPSLIRPAGTFSRKEKGSWSSALRHLCRRAGEGFALAAAASEHAVGDRQGVAGQAPVVDHAEGEDSRHVFAGFLVADRLDPEIGVETGALRLPARGRGGAGVVGG